MNPPPGSRAGVALCSLVIAAAVVSGLAECGIAMPLDSLALHVTPERPREFLYTDKGAAHLFGEAVGPPTRSYHGLYSHMHEFLDGWDLQLAGRPLTQVIEAHVCPDRLVRRYEGLSETITLLDQEPAKAPGAALLLQLAVDGDAKTSASHRPLTLRIVPRIDIRFVWEEVRPDYDVRWDPEEHTLLAASSRHLQRTPAEDWPVWLAMSCSADWSFHAAPRYETVTYPKDAARRAMARATPYRPGYFELQCEPGRPVTICFVLGDEAGAVAARLPQVLQRRDDLVAARRARLQALVDRPGLGSDDARLERAAAWCRLGMDQLVMSQRGLGIYAGYPWFTTYWGRDSFISLAGACLVTGDFATARTILSTFATHQDTNPNSLREGRLPNFVTVNQVQYASADGTWWWMRALRQYERASNNQAFADSLYPVVKRALDGALRHAVDEHGFLKHGDGETWMDAGGEQHPYSPRGDRAIEIQALFAHALDYGLELARRAREREDALRWRETRDRLAASFTSSFFDPQAHTPYDHLNADGTPDRQTRPNGLLAWYVAPDLFTPEQARATIEQVRDRLAYPWSVGSLVSDDPQFRPVHLALDRYYFDEAYHNGDVWLWLSGPLVSGLVSLNQVEAAWQQTSFFMDEILDRGVAGSLREIRDAIDTPGKDEYGGAVAQAWSLAEMQRSLYEDYLGVRYDLPAGRIDVSPMLPAVLERLSARVPAGRSSVRLEYEQTQGRARLRLEPEAGCTGLTLRLALTSPDGSRRAVDLPLDPPHPHEVSLEHGVVSIDGVRVDASKIIELPALPPAPRGKFAFRPPVASGTR